MKNMLLATTAALFTVSANADVIKCGFTEPFVDSTYSMVQQTLTYTSWITGDKPTKTVVKNVSFQIKGAGEFDLVAKDGKVLQTLKLTNKGSDGMSNTIYPFDVEDKGNVKGANNGIGGCSSNYLKTTEGEY